MDKEKELKGDSQNIDLPPDFIINDELAVKYYGEILKMLKGTDLLGDLDRFTLGTLADCLSVMETCKNDLLEFGYVIEQETTNGGMKRIQNPSKAVFKDYSNTFNKMASQFGMTPSSRASLANLAMSEKENAKDPVINIINSKGGAN